MVETRWDLVVQALMRTLLNGMHRTLKEDTTKPPAVSLRAQQSRFDNFRYVFNSTFGNILSRAGLTSPQKKRKRTTPCSEPFSQVTGPNQLWCMDFKGYFTTCDGKRCDPFTITDA